MFLPNSVRPEFDATSASVTMVPPMGAEYDS